MPNSAPQVPPCLILRFGALPDVTGIRQASLSRAGGPYIDEAIVSVADGPTAFAAIRLAAAACHGTSYVNGAGTTVTLQLKRRSFKTFGDASLTYDVDLSLPVNEYIPDEGAYLEYIRQGNVIACILYTYDTMYPTTDALDQVARAAVAKL